MVKRGGASKFPVARIKKIMQADEDIGKVAQATPVVISKALELFLVDLVKSTAAETRSSGARKVTAYHLKRAVHLRDTLDFLKPIVEKVPDPVQSEAGAGSGRKRAGTGAGAGAGRGGKKEEEQEEGDDAAGVQTSRYAYGATEEDSEDEEDEDEEEYEPQGRKGKKVKRE